MSGKILKDKLIKGERVYGTFFQHATQPALVDFLPPGVLDFVIVSAEHNALDIADFLPMKYALNAKGIACLARTHSRDPDDVSKVCDSFDGVVVPYVEDVAHAKALAAAAVYRPLKGKVLQRAIEKNEWPSPKTKEYVTNVRCADTVFIPMIESVPAIENLEAICSIPGVHALFIGPNDLTTNMGIPNEYDHKDLIAMIQKVIDVGNRHHIAAGCWFGRTDQMLRTIRQGARLVVYSNDSVMLKDAMALAFGELKKG
jgi:2-keto-3-deoxy-L-rhamnonate aldolase RhmA